MQQDATEPEPLLHAARECRDAFVAAVPETEPLEQHPDALTPFGDAVEPAEQRQVLERRQLAVDERVVPEVADLFARRESQLAAVGCGEPGEHPEKRRLARAVRPVTSRKPPAASSTSTRASTRLPP